MAPRFGRLLRVEVAGRCRGESPLFRWDLGRRSFPSCAQCVLRVETRRCGECGVRRVQVVLGTRCGAWDRSAVVPDVQ